MWSRNRTSNGASNRHSSFVSRVKPRPSMRATMYTSGSTQSSAAVSNTRIFASSSSNCIVPLLGHEPAGLDADVPQPVEALRQQRAFEALRGGEDRHVRHPFGRFTQAVAAQALGDARPEVVADDGEPGGLRRRDVAGPLLAGRV